MTRQAENMDKNQGMTRQAEKSRERPDRLKNWGNDQTGWKKYKTNPKKPALSLRRLKKIESHEGICLISVSWPSGILLNAYDEGISFKKQLFQKKWNSILFR